MDAVFLIPAALAFAAVALGTIAMVLVLETAGAAKRRREILRRLRPDSEFAADPLAQNLIRQGKNELSDLERVLSKLPRLKDAAFLLQQAKVKWSITTYVLLTVGSGMAMGMFFFMLSRQMLWGVLAALLGSLIPDLYLRTKKKKRIRKFEEQFPESVDLLGRAIRAGHPLSSGMRMVADEAPEPNAGEFLQVFEEQRFGLPFEDALIAMSDRIDLVDVRIFVTAVLIQREVGGNLAEILDKIAMTVRSRFTLRRQLRVYTAQGRLSGYVLAALPIFMAIAIFFLDREYIMVLREEALGRLLVIIAVIMQIMGFLWIRKIIDIEI